MNKSALKTFATAARRQLMEQVAVEAARLGMTSDRPITYATHGDYLTIGQTQYPMAWRDEVESLNQAWHQRGFAALVEEVAYTWFNRFVAIRYMEIHDYLPTHIRVLSSRTPGQVDPDILLHYADLPWPIDVPMLDEAIRTGQRDKVFRQLLIEQCNQLHAAMPFLFEKLNDYTELLLPHHLLHTDSVITRLVHDIAEEDFQEVEVIGWLYQYYISEKNKQIVGMNKGVVQKEDLPAATQLFTPRWIVQYMVQNSLGRAWKASNPENALDQSWDYYLFREEVLASASFPLESIKILDPACGSGHILVYAFDLLFAMYEEMGYPVSAIPALILEKNLFGMDIDARATQLATLALIMKARERDRKFFERNVVPNIVAFQDAPDIAEDILKQVASSMGDRNALHELMKYHQNAKQFGSLLDGYPINTDRFLDRIAALDANAGDMVDEVSVSVLRSQLMPILRQNAMLQDVYDIVITNPPYHNKYNPVLKDFMTKNYKNYKGDLYSAFIYRCAHWTKDNGYTAMMTPFTWMFISSHEKLRNNLLQHYSISSLVQLEYSGFEEATVPICTFVVQHQTHDRKGVYLRLEEFKGPDLQPIKVREAVENRHVSYRYVADSNEFHAIPGSPIAYWASDAVVRLFSHTKLDSFATPCEGMNTGDNSKFIRLWYEVLTAKIGLDYSDRKEALESGRKWFPYNKGGEYRKWYGNQLYVVEWEDDGKAIRSFVDGDGAVRSAVRNASRYFLESITYTDISSSNFGVRLSPRGFLFDSSGKSIFPKRSVKELKYLLAFLACPVAHYLLQMINPTIHVQVGNVASLPLIMDEGMKPTVDRLAQQNIQIAQEDWDDFETSWNFAQHPLVKYGLGVSTIADAYTVWHDHAEQRFRQMQANETELNRLFIHLYGLQDELTPDVPDDDITLRRADEVRDAKSFLSYFIGCLMGRYSLDTVGLAFAGGDWDPARYQTFGPVTDGIVLFTDDRYFESDVISRLEEFLTVLYGASSLAENMRWLAERVDRHVEDDAVTRLRRYFLQNFFKDHCKVYSKRPIYWLFDSGPKKGFRALLYLHRYHPDSIARVRLEHLQPLQRRVAEEMRGLEGRLAATTLSRAERQILESRLEELRVRQEECVRYDQALADLANQRIALDLDDGVKVNYARLQSILAPVR